MNQMNNFWFKMYGKLLLLFFVCLRNIVHFVECLTTFKVDRMKKIFKIEFLGNLIKLKINFNFDQLPFVVNQSNCFIPCLMENFLKQLEPKFRYQITRGFKNWVEGGGGLHGS